MKFVFASYVVTKEFNNPEAWIKRIRAYAGVLESLAVNNEVISIEQIDYEGEYLKNSVQYQFMRFSKTGLRIPLKLHLYIKKLKPRCCIYPESAFPFTTYPIAPATWQ